MFPVFEPDEAIRVPSPLKTAEFVKLLVLIEPSFVYVVPVIFISF